MICFFKFVKKFLFEKINKSIEKVSVQLKISFQKEEIRGMNCIVIENVFWISGRMFNNFFLEIVFLVLIDVLVVYFVVIFFYYFCN